MHTVGSLFFGGQELAVVLWVQQLLIVNSSSSLLGLRKLQPGRAVREAFAI